MSYYIQLNNIINNKMIRQINSFSQIPFASKDKVLCIFDVDDTIMGYKEFANTYFGERISHYKQLHDNDIIAIDFAVADWIEKVEQSTPHHMDYNGYYDLIEKINKTESRHFFLTARNPKFRHITEKHLEQINIKNPNVYYVAGKNKGEYLKNIIDKYEKYERVLFIDDVEKNLHDMKKTFGDKIELYHFVKKFELCNFY